MGGYIQALEKRLSKKYNERVIATAALCGCQFVERTPEEYDAGAYMVANWSYEGCPGPTARYQTTTWFTSKVKAAKAFIEEKGIQVDYGLFPEKR